MTPDELRKILLITPYDTAMDVDGMLYIHGAPVCNVVTLLEWINEANEQIANLRGGLQQGYVKRKKLVKRFYEFKRQNAGDVKRLEAEVEKQKTIGLAWKRRYKKAMDDLGQRQEQIEIIHLKEEIGMLKAQNRLLEFALADIYRKSEQALNDIGYFSPQG